MSENQKQSVEGWEDTIRLLATDASYEDKNDIIKIVKILLSQQQLEVVEMIKKMIQEKKKFFDLASNGSTDASLYAKGVSHGLHDILQSLSTLNINK